jgi:predicted PurR-regulated permease PerM
MLSIDDRAGNVMTTVAVFMIAAAILYLARGVLFILLLSLLFAYLLEPAVALIQRHSWLGEKGKSRSWAIVKVYVAGLLILGSLGHWFGPILVGQMKSLNAALPHVLNDLSTGQAAAGQDAKQAAPTAPEQQRIHDWLARNHDALSRAFERGAVSAAYATANSVWLFAVPILAIFILRDGRQMEASVIQVFGLRGDQTRAKRILGKVDTMLARYVRSQLAMAGLSFVFYSTAMLILGFPYAIALGFLGGVLEFLPAVGWLASGAAMLIAGFLTHAHWIWMAALLVPWRLVQNYVNSPRIMGNNLQLQPLTVLFALMVGGKVGGIAGVFLSVPIAAVLRIIWLEYVTPQSSPDALSQHALTHAGV